MEATVMKPMATTTLSAYKATGDSTEGLCLQPESSIHPRGNLEIQDAGKAETDF